MSERHELIKSSIESLLLCLINHQPMYGYQIIKELENRSQGYFRFKEGTLYPGLHRLEGRGMIQGKWDMLPSGQQRKYYHITARGAALLEEKRNRWSEFFTAMNLIISPPEVNT